MCKLCDNINDYSMNPRIETYLTEFNLVLDWEQYEHYGDNAIGEVSTVINFCLECGKDLRKL